MPSLASVRAGIDDEQLGRAIAYAAALRHHCVSTSRTTTPTGTPSTTRSPRRTRSHHALQRNPTPALRRGCVHAALRVYLDRFLNVPAARLPRATTGDLDALAQCFEVQGGVDDAGNEAYGFLRGGGSRAELIAALGHALLVEDAGFHWFQTVEAGIRQAEQWPEASEESALVLAGVARFLAAHTPTPARAPDGRAHRDAAPPRRSALRRRRRGRTADVGVG